MKPIEKDEPKPEEVKKSFNDFYVEEIQKYIKSGKLNNHMEIKLILSENEHSFKLITIDCYYVDRTQCLAQCDDLRLDTVIDFKKLGKYLQDLQDNKYELAGINIYDENGIEIYNDSLN